MAFLEENRMIHGDIRPELISVPISKEDNFRLVDRLSDPSPPINVQLNNLRNKKNLYMAPIFYYSFINRKLSIKHSPFKSDIFSLGMVLLEVGLLKSVQSIYSKENKGIDKENMISLVQEFVDKYDDNILQESLMIMLEFGEELRQTPSELIETIKSLKSDAKKKGTLKQSVVNNQIISKLHITKSGYELKNPDGFLNKSNFIKFDEISKISEVDDPFVQDSIHDSLINQIKKNNKNNKKTKRFIEDEKIIKEVKEEQIFNSKRDHSLEKFNIKSNKQKNSKNLSKNSHSSLLGDDSDIIVGESFQINNKNNHKIANMVTSKSKFSTEELKSNVQTDSEKMTVEEIERKVFGNNQNQREDHKFMMEMENLKKNNLNNNNNSIKQIQSSEESVSSLKYKPSLEGKIMSTNRESMNTYRPASKLSINEITLKLARKNTNDNEASPEPRSIFTQSRKKFDRLNKQPFDYNNVRTPSDSIDSFRNFGQTITVKNRSGNSSYKNSQKNSAKNNRQALPNYSTTGNIFNNIKSFNLTETNHQANNNRDSINPFKFKKSTNKIIVVRNGKAMETNLYNHQF